MASVPYLRVLKFCLSFKKLSIFNFRYNSLKFSTSRIQYKMKGLVLGVYTEPSENCNEVAVYTSAFKEVDEKCGGNLSAMIKATGPFYKPTKHKLIWTPTLGDLKVDGTFNCLSVVDLGAKELKDNTLEDWNQKSENIRCAIAGGVKALLSASQFEDIFLDPCDEPQSVAEAAALCTYSYDELKQKSSSKPKSNLHLYKCINMQPESISEFDRGLLFAESQNFARTLMETPANLMTPTIFASVVSNKFKGTPVKVVVRDEDWIKSMNMGSFLSVAKGSDEKPKFLELHYDGLPSSKENIALVGKGITFDSGGISLKQSANMDKMRADMGGAACLCASIHAACVLGLKINIKGFFPLCENLPSGKANKPGDVVYAMNGKSIQVDNTDAEGRLVLADGLCYAQKFNPLAILDAATLTGAICGALGSSATGVFSNDDQLWNLMHEAGTVTGDRMWRMPLFRHFTKMVTDCQLADLNNIAKPGSYGGANIAASFLQEFVAPDMKWLHLDIAGVMENKNEVPYLGCGMSGRPTRTIIQFLKRLADTICDKNSL